MGRTATELVSVQQRHLTSLLSALLFLLQQLLGAVSASEIIDAFTPEIKVFDKNGGYVCSQLS